MGDEEAAVAKLLLGDRRTLARAVTAVANDSPDAQRWLRGIYDHVGQAMVIGFTGPPGAGKSTLINAFVGALRRDDKKVAVVAVDPSSPKSGGAILGDRIRMTEHGGDEGVFIRSLSSKGHLGGLSRTTARVVDLFDAAGFDVVLVETVGTGQSEIEIMHLAETTVVVCAPGLGDEIQAQKAGILEIADVLVVNKADLPLATRVVAQLNDALSLDMTAAWRVPIVQTTATSGQGIEELATAIAAHRAQLPVERLQRTADWRVRRLLANAAAERLRQQIEQCEDRAVDELCRDVLRGDQSFDAAVVQLCRLLVQRDRVR